MKNMVMTAVMFGAVFAQSQSPIIRVKQIGTWDTPQTWWKDSQEQNLSTFLAEDSSAPAFKNNNFDAWRDKLLEIEVTLDDNNTGTNYITAVRFDIAFDNDLITWIEQDIDGDGTDETSVNAWSQGNSKVTVGSHISGWTEGDDSTANPDTTDYSFEVVHFSNVGYRDSLAVSGNQIEQSISDDRYDWLRITMVSHGHDDNNDGIPDKHFGGGNGVEKQLIKLQFKINDVNDDFAPKSFRVATQYDGSSGYYTYVSDDYLLPYKVYIDGNWGNTTEDDRTFNGAARGDITLHPKLVDVEGYFRYIGEFIDADGDQVRDNGEYTRNNYAYWKVLFELDESNTKVENGNTVPVFSNWLNVRDIDDQSSLTDETTTDDVIGTNSDSEGYYYYTYDDQHSAGHTPSPADQKVGANGFEGVSYWDWTHTDDKGYFNISLPRNNRYRVSFWPPDADDYIGDHTHYTLDRYNITNVVDARAAFNFQSNKFRNSEDIDIATPSAYLIGDVDGDDVFQLNDAYFIWAYSSGVFENSYTHTNGNTYQSWASIDNLKSDGSSETLNYYQTQNGVSSLQKREFSIFVDDELAQEDSLLYSDAGGVAWFNPLMDDVQTGLDTLIIELGAGSSDWTDNTETSMNDVNPDYYFTRPDGVGTSKQVDILGTTNDSDIAYYFTGDMNLTGVKVDVNGTATTPQVNGTTSYRWGNGDAPDEWARTIDNNRSLGKLSATTDVELLLPDDESVKVQMGNQVVVPLTIKPYTDEVTGELTKIAAFEFEIKYKTGPAGLTFLDAQTGLLPGPWMTYLNESEVDDEGYKTLSFGALDNSPNNAPQDYYITEEMTALQLIFRSNISDNNPNEWITAPLNFVGKYAAGNPNGDDLIMDRQDGIVRIWNKYWAFGGGRPEEDELTYVYPNPYNQSEHTDINFQFFMEQAGDVKISVYNINGQKIKTIFEGSVQEGLHNFKFDELPESTDPQLHSGYENLDSGIYVFLMETDNKIKSKKFTIIK
jgi:hypothetical protein